MRRHHAVIAKEICIQSCTIVAFFFFLRAVGAAGRFAAPLQHRRTPFEQLAADDETTYHRAGRVDQLSSFAESRFMTTGTTIAGVIFKDGVVLGADTRATGGRTVCDRNCDKIHILADNIACCGAGTSADAERITEGVRVSLLRMALEMHSALSLPQLQRLSEGKVKETDAVQRKYGKVSAAAYLLKRHLFRYQGMVSAALILGGVDSDGPHLYQIHQGGSFGKVAFTAMGSGSLAALSVLESGHQERLDESRAKELVVAAIKAGIDNDLGSGSNVDICVITSARGLEHFRGELEEELCLTGDQHLRGPEQHQHHSRRHDGDESEGEQLSVRVATGDGDAFGGRSSAADLGGLAGHTTLEHAGDDSSQADETKMGLQVSGFKDRHEVDYHDHLNCGATDDEETSREAEPESWTARVTTTKRRNGRKDVLRVDNESNELRTFRHDALDDKIEIL